MTFTELKEHFEKHAIEGAPSEDGMYLAQIQMRGLAIARVSLVNIWVDQPEPGELHLQVGPWEGYVKSNVIVRHLPLELSHPKEETAP